MSIILNKDTKVIVQGITGKTAMFHTKQMPSKLDTVSFQVRDVDLESGVAFGLITRIIRRHARTR